MEQAQRVPGGGQESGQRPRGVSIRHGETLPVVSSYCCLRGSGRKPVLWHMRGSLGGVEGVLDELQHHHDPTGRGPTRGRQVDTLGMGRSGCRAGGVDETGKGYD